MDLIVFSHKVIEEMDEISDILQFFIIFTMFFSALQIPDSRYEKKNTQNEQIIAHFEYFLLVTIVRLFNSLRISTR